MPPKSGQGSRRRASRSGSASDGAASTPAANGRELRARGQRTQRRLLDAAVEVFAARGYHAARVDDIVKAAATSHGTFYLYFANKEELFTALAAEVAEQMRTLGNSLPPVPPGPEGVAVLREWLGRFVDLYERYAPVVRAWTESEIAGDGVGQIGEELLTQISSTLGERVSESSQGVNATVAGGALLAMIERLAYYMVTEQMRLDRDAVVDTLARVAHASMYGTA